MGNELDNRIVIIGNQVAIAGMPASRAVELINADQQLGTMEDDALVATVHQAELYWRALIGDVAVDNPDAVMIYPYLIAECVGRRTKAVGKYRRGAPAQDGPKWDARFDMWLTLLARSNLSKGMGLLLKPYPEDAFLAFKEAEMSANALPDLDRPRI